MKDQTGSKARTGTRLSFVGSTHKVYINSCIQINECHLLHPEYVRNVNYSIPIYVREISYMPQCQQCPTATIGNIELS